MTPAKLWALCEFYDKAIADEGYEPKEFNPEQYGGKKVHMPDLLRHCRWMMRECLARFKSEYEAAVIAPVGYPLATEKVREQWFEAHDAFHKAMRWMCYVQCALNVYGVFSCSELRAHSREGKEKGVAPPLVRSVFPPRPSTPLVEVDDRMKGIEFRFPPSAMSMDHLNWPPTLVGVTSNCPTVPPAERRRTDLVPAFPCCEGARRIERKPGDATTLQGGWCPEHGLSLYVDAVIETDTDRYVRLEKEHLGDPDKKTGIYAERTVKWDAEQTEHLRKRLASVGSFPIPALTDEQLDRARLDRPPRPTEDTCSDDGTPK